MLADIEDGTVGCVIVKDMSRIGRNYLEVGFYTEVLFRKKNVRFIAISNEEAATVVRRIYQLIIEGNGPMHVARILKDEKVERPSYYLAKQGLGTCREILL